MVAITQQAPAGVSTPMYRRAPRPRRAVTSSSPVVYRRRRIVTAALTLGVLLGGGAVADMVKPGPLAGSTSAPPVLVSDSVHIVQPGDTLWTIARRLQPTGDVRRLVDRLAAARGGAPLHVGERLALPSR